MKDNKVEKKNNENAKRNVAVAIFFRDAKGRLRCNFMGSTRPVERASDGKRYKWAKVFGLYRSITGWPDDIYTQLQNAQEGDVIELPIDKILREAYRAK